MLGGFNDVARTGRRDVCENSAKRLKGMYTDCAQEHVLAALLEVRKFGKLLPAKWTGGAVPESTLKASSTERLRSQSVVVSGVRADQDDNEKMTLYADSHAGMAWS